MNEFICKTLSPEVFWSALAAVGTISAVFVALLIPFYNSYKENINIKKLILKELESNIKIIAKTQEFNKKINLANINQTIDTNLVNIGMFKELNLNIWNAHKFKISIKKPDFYAEIDVLNNYILKIINILDKNSTDDFQVIAFIKFQHDNLKDVLTKSKYKDKLNKID